MQVGVCKLKLHLPASESLKAKRQVLKSLIQRTRNRFEVAVSEVGDQDLWQLAEIGIACVSNDGQHANEVLSHVVDFIENGWPDLAVVDYEIEIVPVL
jgi:uncharacterized protein